MIGIKLSVKFRPEQKLSGVLFFKKRKTLKEIPKIDVILTTADLVNDVSKWGKI